MKGDPTSKKIAPLVRIRLSGSGGQGLVLAGRLLAEAASIHDRLNVVQTKAYGPEARGGASRSDVLISPGEIDDIGGEGVDVLVCLNQQSCDKYLDDLIYHGLLLVDSSNVKVVPASHAVVLPLTQTAIDACGTPVAANVLALGVLCGICNIVSSEAIHAAVKSNVKPRFLDINRKVLQAGYDLAGETLGKLDAGVKETVKDFGYLRNLLAASSAEGEKQNTPAKHKGE